VGWLVAPSSAKPAEPTSAEGVTRGAIDAVRETTEAFSRLDYRFGGGHARSALIQYLTAEVEPVLKRASPDTELGRQFFIEVAALLRLAGWQAYDIGRHGLAQQYLTQGLELASILHVILGWGRLVWSRPGVVGVECGGHGGGPAVVPADAFRVPWSSGWGLSQAGQGAARSRLNAVVRWWVQGQSWSRCRVEVRPLWVSRPATLQMR
jgi:hypothetical protein